MKIARYEIDGQIGYGRLNDNGTIHAFEGLPFETSEFTGQTQRFKDGLKDSVQVCRTSFGVIYSYYYICT